MILLNFKSEDFDRITIILDRYKTRDEYKSAGLPNKSLTFEDCEKDRNFLYRLIDKYHYSVNSLEYHLIQDWISWIDEIQNEEFRISA